MSVSVSPLKPLVSVYYDTPHLSFTVDPWARGTSVFSWQCHPSQKLSNLTRPSKGQLCASVYDAAASRNLWTPLWIWQSHKSDSGGHFHSSAIRGGASASAPLQFITEEASRAIWLGKGMSIITLNLTDALRTYILCSFFLFSTTSDNYQAPQTLIMLMILH